jgi:hypothetical protein
MAFNIGAECDKILLPTWNAFSMRTPAPLQSDFMDSGVTSAQTGTGASLQFLP